jgi:hypothetical protein
MVAVTKKLPSNKAILALARLTFSSLKNPRTLIAWSPEHL